MNELYFCSLNVGKNIKKRNRNLEKIIHYLHEALPGKTKHKWAYLLHQVALN
jgi:hypothetical protein